MQPCCVCFFVFLFFLFFFSSVRVVTHWWLQQEMQPILKKNPQMDLQLNTIFRDMENGRDMMLTHTHTGWAQWTDVFIQPLELCNLVQSSWKVQVFLLTFLRYSNFCYFIRILNQIHQGAQNPFVKATAGVQIHKIKCRDCADRIFKRQKELLRGLSLHRLPKKNVPILDGLTL